MSKKDVSRYLFWSKTQSEVIPPERIPERIDLSKVVDQFSIHKHHMGSWPTGTPPPTPHSNQPPNHVGYASHVVREVHLTEDGGLRVDFDFINTIRGFQFMHEYYEEDDFQMVPVLDEDEINIVRFDFHRSINHE